ncbi:hypothetical protein Cgig2_023578 [Carnegiea gigantea]|uniref:Uncharacterized protein n=1 Tax=Carnegiea gigantea TaxID=171969 RepID=A0A9Q1JJY2_9CARY|nr:hypothetical protein Cgig2_023578 [Carnegiea gigantea]
MVWNMAFCRDRSWMNHRGISDRRKPDYIAGINEFLELAFDGTEDGIEHDSQSLNSFGNYNPLIHHGEYEDHINSSDDGIEEEPSNRVESFADVDGCDDSLWENMEVEIANPIEIQDGNDEEIPLVRDDVEADIVDVYIVDANLVDDNPHDYFFIWKFEACKHWPTRGVKSLRERDQNPNVKPFAKITPDMERVIGKNANRFIGDYSKWVKKFCPLGSRLKEEHFAGKTITSAITNRPPKVHKDKWDWLVNHWADPKHAQDPTQEIDEVPTYVQLWERTKRHKDGFWDPKAVAKYEEFKELHMS